MSRVERSRVAVRWRAIALATALLAPAMWSLLIGAVAAASDESNRPAAGPPIAFGLCLIPFVFVALAFASERRGAPGAVVQAMLLCLLVGIPVSALAGDVVTGVVAGTGAGGAIALRREVGHGPAVRAVGVALATLYAFTLVRVAGPSVLVVAPAFPFTAVGLADHYSERRVAGR